VKIISICSAGVLAIRIRELSIPAFAIRDGSAVLICDYDLEGDQLYSLNWYKNGLEFYRYIPRKTAPFTVYQRPGVNVDRKKSNDRQVSSVRTVANVGRKGR